MEEPKKKKAKRPSVINWKQFETLVLIHANETRHQQFTQVSRKTAKPWAERMVWERIIKPMVRQMPSKGCRIYPPTVDE
jgi:hypothetical protein